MRPRKFWFLGTRNYLDSLQYSYRCQRRWGNASRIEAAAVVIGEIGHEIWERLSARIICPLIGHREVFKMYMTFCDRCGNGVPMGGQVRR